MAPCLKCIKCQKCECPPTLTDEWVNAQVITVTGHTAITTQGVYTLGPGHHARPGQVITVPKGGGQTIGHTRQKRNVSKPTVDDPLLFPRLVQRGFSAPLPTEYPSAGLERNPAHAAPFLTRLVVSDGRGKTKISDLRFPGAYLLFRDSPVYGYEDVVNGLASVRLPGNRILAVGSNPDGTRLPVYTFEDSLANPTSDVPDVALNPLNMADLFDEGTFPGERGGLSESAISAAAHLSAGYVLLSAINVGAVTGTSSMYVQVVTARFSGAGDYGTTTSAWLPVAAPAPTDGVDIRSASTTDGVIFWFVEDSWFRTDAGGTQPADPPTIQGGTLLVPGQGVLSDSLQTGAGFWGTRSALNLPVPWNSRPDLQATVTKREHLKGGLTVLTLDALPAGLLGEWPNSAGGLLVPHLPGVIVDDPKRTTYTAHPPGTLVTWEGVHAGGFYQGKAQAVARLKTAEVPEFYPNYVDPTSVPGVDFDTPPMVGAEVFPVDVTVDGGTLIGNPKLLTVPALTQKFKTVLTWRVPIGTHTLTFEFPSAAPPPLTQAFQAVLAMDWRQLRRLLDAGSIDITVGGLQGGGKLTPPPKRQDGRRYYWFQRGYPLALDDPAIIRITTTEPITLKIAQVSKTTTTW